MNKFAFAGNHYVPRLLWKRGEQNALAQVSTVVKAQMTPLVDFPGDHKGIARGIQALVTGWGKAPFFLDANVFGKLAPQTVLGALSAGLQPIPVLTLAATSAPQPGYLGVALRVPAAQFGISAALWALVASVLNTWGLSSADVHLILDFADGANGHGKVLASAWHAIFSSMPMKFRSFTVLATSFPASLGAVVKNATTALFPRFEWIDWQLLHQYRAQLPFLPTFGDYAVQNPAPPPTEFKPGMTTIPTSRYTLDREWLFIRGINPKTSNMKPSPQFQKIASQLISLPVFYGAQHCGGCSDITACANKTMKLGSPEVWRRAATVHHLTLATHQIASLPWP